MANQKIVLAELDLDVKGLIAAAQQSKDAIAALNKELGNLKAAGQDSSAQFAKMQQDIKMLTQLLASQNEAITNQVKQNNNLATAQTDLTTAINKTSTAQQNLTEKMEANSNANDEYAENAADAAEAITTLNEALKANSTLMNATDDGTQKQVKTFNDYKDQVTESFDSINIFNGGLGGLISRAQEAGGAGPLVKNAFMGISEGIGGMTKASLTFIATPIGAILAAIGIVLGSVISYFKDTQEGIDKVTAVTRPLQAVFSALMGVFQKVGKNIVDVFSNPLKSIESFGTAIKENLVNRVMGFVELIPNLGKSIGLLFEGNFTEAGKVAADSISKVALGTDNLTGKIAGAIVETGTFLKEAYDRGQKIDELQKSLDKGMAGYTKRNSDLTIELDKQSAVADDTNATFAQRETAARKAIETAKEHNKLMLDRLDSEIELLRLKQEEDGITDAEKNELAEMVAKRNEAAAQYEAGEKALQGKLSSIKDEAAEKDKARRQKLVQDALQKQKLELDQYIQTEGQKAQSLQQELAVVEEIKNKKIALAEAEFKAGDKSANEARKRDLAINQAKIEGLKTTASATAAYAQSELDLYIQTHISQLDNAKLLTQDLVNEEAKRLEEIKKQKLKILETETGINDKIIAQKRANNEALSIEDNAYLTKKAATEMEFKTQIDANNEKLDAQTKAQKATQLQADRQIALGNAQTQYEADLIVEQQRFDDENARLAVQLEKNEITKQQFDDLSLQNEAKNVANKKKIEDDLADYQLSLKVKLLGDVAELLGKNTAAGKAAAIAQATINTYTGVTQVLAAPSVLPEPFGTAQKFVSAGLVVASGLSAVKKITSTKTPKAEKGALFTIGGNRHSNGGTMFTGADGTRFEAEQGELIGVMNRNAAAHFMAFNNAFPAGGSSAPNYFASGGIVSREMAQPGLNIDELAAKIAVANAAIPAPVVAVQDIISQGNSYVRVRDAANF